tara:strand:- start:514 stop:957 length:444 start_codon:yes stop_codon:yes gene_type:complete
MKNIILYLFSIIAAIIIIYYIKKSNIQNQTDGITELRHSDYIRSEIEVLNGCGESGVANLFTKFLRSEGYDVIEIKNADNFQYKETIILFHNEKVQEEAEILSAILNVKQNNIKFNKNSVWDLSVIIGADYKNLDSFEKIKPFYELF